MKVSAALATPAIAFLGFCIAWGQWATARSKLILDLYEKRRQVFSELHGPIGEAVRGGRADHNTFTAFIVTIDRAQFLFGRDVMDYVNDMRETINHFIYETTMLEGGRLKGTELEAMYAKKDESFKKIVTFYDDMTKLMTPYMLMDQKRPWSPARIPSYFASKARQGKKSVMKWWRRRRSGKPG
jgi:hypothetical protein